MIKDHLIFNWQESESHFGFKVIAFVIVAIVFTGLFAIIDVRLEAPPTPSFQAASIIHFTDETLGQALTTVAEEEGPFPGRLEIAGADGLANLLTGGDSGVVGNWSDYEIGLREFQEDPEIVTGSLAQKGLRHFPARVKIATVDLPFANSGDLREPAQADRTAILSAFDENSMEWMPDQVAEFQIPLKAGDVVSASLRFMIRLRPDGSVSDCIPLAGAADEGANEVGAWLEGLRYKPGSGERWLGLRVELINR